MGWGEIVLGMVGLAALYLIGTWVVLHTPWLMAEAMH